MGKFSWECAESLTLYVRTVAWLHATLKPPQKSRKSKRAADHDAPRITRQEKFQAEDIEHTMPDAGPAAYLLDIFFDVGPVLYSSMGESPIGYEQLVAWEQAHGVRLLPWEVGTLRSLSLAYLGEKVRSEDPSVAAPGSIDETPEDAVQRRERISKGLAQALGAFKRR